MISVVIISKNEAGNIAVCIQSALRISNDVVVIDSGSTDGTQQIAKDAGAKVVEVAWEGFGNTRNTGALEAANNWIFSLDCDERISEELVANIEQLRLTQMDKVYAFKRLNFLGNKPVHYGEWGRDTVNRLYNRNYTSWTSEPVHETIELHGNKPELITGNLIHYTYKNPKVFAQKMEYYASLYAARYASKMKHVPFIKRYLSPVFSFIQNYFFRLGFLDGKAGFIIAKTTALYTYLKYKKLASLK